MKYILKTTYPCLVGTQNELCELDSLDTLEVEDEKFLMIYPQNATQIPFQVDFSQESPFYSIVNRNDRSIVLLESPKSLFVTKKEKLTVSGKTCQISLNDQFLEFETDTHKFALRHKNEDFNVKKIKNFACAIFEHEIYALNMQTNKFICFSGDEITVKDDEIALIKKFGDSLQRQKEAKYKLDDDVKIESETFSHSKVKDSARVVPFRLLESVKAKDYACALEYLSENLRSSINDEMLKQFFGNLKHFLPIDTNQFITFADEKKMYVTFSVAGSKIDDISIDDL